jgi:hypothetical protein
MPGHEPEPVDLHAEIDVSVFSFAAAAMNTLTGGHPLLRTWSALTQSVPVGACPVE